MREELMDHQMNSQHYALQQILLQQLQLQQQQQQQQQLLEK